MLYQNLYIVGKIGFINLIFIEGKMNLVFLDSTCIAVAMLNYSTKFLPIKCRSNLVYYFISVDNVRSKACVCIHHLL